MAQAPRQQPGTTPDQQPAQQPQAPENQRAIQPPPTPEPSLRRLILENIGTIIFVLIIIVLIGTSLIRRTNNTGVPPSGGTPAAGTSPWADLWWSIFESPLNMVIAIVFLGIILLGARKHWKVEGNGAMHAVTIIAALTFLFVVVPVVWRVFTDGLWQGQAATNRQIMRSWLANLLDPSKLGNGDPASWLILIGGSLVVVALIGMVVSLFRKGGKK